MDFSFCVLYFSALEGITTVRMVPEIEHKSAANILKFNNQDMLLRTFTIVISF